jgi:heme-degrading monooxygenase HmoA
MPKFVEMDEKVTFFAQIGENSGPIILINKFTVKPEDADRFLQAFAMSGAMMKRQPGFISTQLHRSIAGSRVFINCPAWESTEHFRQAFNNPECQSLMTHFPAELVASPHLFRKVAVPGVCAG